MLYLSHKITAETPELQGVNCLNATIFAKGLRCHFPDVGFYVPAESEPFVEKTFRLGYLTVEQILDIDCEIIRKDCNGVIFYTPDGKLSKGMQVEFNFCQLEGVPWLIVTDLDIYEIKLFIEQLGE